MDAPLREKVLQMDLGGTLLLLAAVVCFLLAMQWAGVSKAWGSASVIGIIVGTVLLAAIFLGAEMLLKERATLNMRLLRRKPIALLMMHQVCICSTFFVLLYYLPIYFQAVSGTSPAQSGVRIIPLLATSSVCAIVSGIIISVTGDFQLVMITGNALTTVGSSLVFTLDAGAAAGRWIGYQLPAGIGLGLSVQIAIIACQALVDASDLATASAMALFFQLVAGAIWLSVAQTVFANRLLQTLGSAFGDRAHEIFDAGPIGMRGILDADELQTAIWAYMQGLKAAYAVALALGGAAVVVSAVFFIVDRRKLKSGAARKTG